MIVSVRRVGKWMILLATTALLLTGAARVAVNRYLASARGKTMVADKLGSAIGMPVEVTEVEVREDNTSSFRFRVMDPTDRTTEVLNVPAASADVSLADFVTGDATPSNLKLTGAALTLRVGSDGQLRTTLPPLPGSRDSMPVVTLNDGRVCVRQVDRADFALSGVQLKLTPSGNMVRIAGSVNDPKWGAWTIRGELWRSNRTGWVEFATEDAPLDPELLVTIPCVSPEVFGEVTPAGRAAVTIRLTLAPGGVLQPEAEIRPFASLPEAAPGTVFRLTNDGDRFRFEPVP